MPHMPVFIGFYTSFWWLAGFLIKFKVLRVQIAFDEALFWMSSGDSSMNHNFVTRRKLGMKAFSASPLNAA